MVQLNATLTNVFEGNPIIITIVKETKLEAKNILSDSIMKACIKENVFGTFLLEEEYEKDGEYLDRDEIMINVISPQQVKKENSKKAIMAKELQLMDNVLDFCNDKGIA